MNESQMVEQTNIKQGPASQTALVPAELPGALIGYKMQAIQFT